MLFNSYAFFAFYAVILIVCFATKDKIQNFLLLSASYFFYGFWDLHFLLLLLLLTVITYYLSKLIFKFENSLIKKVLLIVSVATSLSILGFFKYFNFFVESLSLLFAKVGIKTELPIMEIILPVGISFYTFSTISYTMDVYRKKITPTNNFFDFALFIAFFPKLLAGPIERASHLLPQISCHRVRNSDQFKRGVYLVLFGLFKKVVIADAVAVYVNMIFGSDEIQPGINIFIASVLFTIQIYCDFSGYTDIARGISKTLGFDLKLNFNLPYFSKNPKEFWQRWHISLSTWLRDYLYIPLGGNRFGRLITYRNLIITMFLGGLWHGAAWNYVWWGLYHGVLLVFHRLCSPLFDRFFPKSLAINVTSVFCFFILTCYGWLIFRAESFNQIIIFSNALVTNLSVGEVILPTFTEAILLGILLLVILDGYQYFTCNTRFYEKWPWLFRYLLYSLLIVLIIISSGNAPEEFIYLQF